MIFDGIFDLFGLLKRSKKKKVVEEVLKERDAFIEYHEGSSKPWAMFEIDGFEEDGRIKVRFSWNSAFIKKINDLGFQAETEDDSVQLFFYASQMRPTELSSGDDAVQSAEHPQLSSQQNILRK